MINFYFIIYCHHNQVDTKDLKKEELNKGNYYCTKHCLVIQNIILLWNFEDIPFSSFDCCMSHAYS